MHMKQAAILSANTNSLHIQGSYHLDERFIHSIENHFCNLHSRFIRYAKTIYKTRSHAGFFNPLADSLSATMNNDRLESNKLEEHTVLNHLLLQRLICHCTTPILYYYNPTVETLYVRQSLNKHLRFFDKFFVHSLNFYER